MNRSILGWQLLLATLCPASIIAQVSGPTFEAALGLARRSAPSPYISLDGFQATARLGYPVAAHVRVLTALSWTTFSDKDQIACAFLTGCAASPIGGLRMAAATGGLEAVVPVAGVEIRPSGMIGGFWLYHHPSGLSDQACGFDTGLALGLPIGAHERILLEGRWVHVLGAAGTAASSRHFTLGFALK